jgi:hypothetical protein
MWLPKLYIKNAKKWYPLKWWNGLWGHKELSSSSAPPIPIRSGDQLPQATPGKLYNNPLGRPSDYLSSQPEHLFWVSFRKGDDEGTFLGVVIARGKSPGDAASRTIDRLELPSNRAAIVMIPVEREGEFEQYQDRLLDENLASELLKRLDISINRS